MGIFVITFRLGMPDFGPIIHELFHNSTDSSMNIIGNKLDFYPLDKNYDQHFKWMMNYTHAVSDVKNYLIMGLHLNNLTQETYFIKDKVSL